MSTTSTFNSSPKPTSVPATLESFTKTWQPHLVATVNDQHVKVGKIEGEFIWHAHPNSDELFYVLAGSMDLEIEGQDTVHLKEGDIFTVPAGIRHRPIGRNASIMMVEKEGTVNTGDEVGSERRVEVVDVVGKVER